MIACPLLLPREILVSRYLYKFWEGSFLNTGLDFGTLYLYAFWWACCLVVDFSLVGSGSNLSRINSSHFAASPWPLQPGALSVDMVLAGSSKNPEARVSRPASWP